MEEKNERKKISVVTIVLIILIIVMILGGVIFLLRKSKTVEENVIPVETKYKVEELTKIDLDKDYVFTSYTEESDLLDSGYTKMVKFPEINLTGEYVAEINNEIKAIVDVIKDQKIENSITKIDYEWSYKEDILSLKIIRTQGFMNSSANNIYYMYNVNCKTGQPVTLEEACNIFNVDLDDIRFELVDDKLNDTIDFNDTNVIKAFYIDKMSQLQIYNEIKYYSNIEGQRVLSYAEEGITTVKARDTYTSGDLKKFNSIYYGTLQNKLGNEISLIINHADIVSKLDNGYILYSNDIYFVLSEEDYNKLKDTTWNDEISAFNVTFLVRGNINRLKSIPESNLEGLEASISNEIDDYYRSNRLYLKDARLVVIDETSTENYNVKEEDIYYNFSDDIYAYNQALYLISKRPYLYDDIKSVQFIAKDFQIEKADNKYILKIECFVNGEKYTDSVDITNEQFDSLTKLNIDENLKYHGAVKMEMNLLSSTGYFIKSLEELDKKTYDALNLYELSTEDEPLKQYILEHAILVLEENQNYMKQYTLVCPYIKKENNKYYIGEGQVYDINLNKITENPIRFQYFTDEDYSKIKDSMIASDKDGYRIYNGIVTLYENNGVLHIIKHKSF